MVRMLIVENQLTDIGIVASIDIIEQSALLYDVCFCCCIYYSVFCFHYSNVCFHLALLWSIVDDNNNNTNNNDKHDWNRYRWLAKTKCRAPEREYNTSNICANYYHSTNSMNSILMSRSDYLYCVHWPCCSVVSVIEFTNEWINFVKLFQYFGKRKYGQQPFLIVIEIIIIFRIVRFGNCVPHLIMNREAKQIYEWKEWEHVAEWVWVWAIMPFHVLSQTIFECLERSWGRYGYYAWTFSQCCHWFWSLVKSEDIPNTISIKKNKYKQIIAVMINVL